MDKTVRESKGTNLKKEKRKRLHSRVMSYASMGQSCLATQVLPVYL